MSKENQMVHLFFVSEIECIPEFPLRTFYFDLHDNYADTG